MKLLFDFLPILLFFLAFKLFDIYIATAVGMVASLLQVAFYWLKHRRFESLHVITFVLVTVLGGATLLFHNATFIKWKPTAIYWAFAIAFLGSRFIGQKPLLQSLMEKNLTLPQTVWQRLNLSWVIFFGLMGTVNLYVVYHFSTNTWVNFKLFGALGLTIVFLIAQALYMTKYMNVQSNKLPK
jgi:intracellular septation protein